MFFSNSGRFWPKYFPAAAMDIRLTFRKSGVRPIIPQVILAQLRIISRRRSKSSWVLGVRKDRPTWSPVVGDL